MARISSFFNNFISLFLLLLHLGCFFCTSKDYPHSQSSKKRKAPSPSISPSRPNPTHKALSSSWSYFKRIFSGKTSGKTGSLASFPSQQSIVSLMPPETIASADIPPPRKKPSQHRRLESDISFNHPIFPLRNDIFPCPICGEIFPKPVLLEQHQSIKHAVSELIDGDSGKNIVGIIFKTGWNDKDKNPTIHRILKIHTSPKILSRFEEYRETVKAKAAARNGGVRRRDERCVADGNELLRFHCTTFLCELGHNGNSGICNHQFCNLCGIIRSGFSPKLDGISTLSGSWKAHVAIPDDIEEEFAFMNVKDRKSVV